MRLFVAVTPPPTALQGVADAVAAARHACPEEAAGLRWTRPATWHVTLAFYGEVGPERLERLGDRLARAARRHAPLSVAFRGAGVFGGQVLWLGVTGELHRLRRLAWSLAAAGRREGLDVPTRTYRPHLSLARVRSGPAATAVPARLTAMLAAFDGPSWTVDQVALVSSRTGPVTAHETLRRWPLTGRR